MASTATIVLATLAFVTKRRRLAWALSRSLERAEYDGALGDETNF